MAKKIPMRQCVGCKELKEKRELIRILKTDTGILLDETGRQNGRGAYICKNPQCLQTAFKTKGLERSLKTSIPEEIKLRLEEEMNHINE